MMKTINYSIGAIIFLYGAFSSKILYTLIGIVWLVATYYWAKGGVRFPIFYAWYQKSATATSEPITVKRGRGRPRKKKGVVP